VRCIGCSSSIRRDGGSRQGLLIRIIVRYSEPERRQNAVREDISAVQESVFISRRVRHDLRLEIVALRHETERSFSAK
jgi:hypothetical protein